MTVLGSLFQSVITLPKMPWSLLHYFVCMLRYPFQEPDDSSSDSGFVSELYRSRFTATEDKWDS